MTNAQLVGYAVANDEVEHQSLSDYGYEPKYVAPEVAAVETIESVRAALDAAAIEYDKRWGLERLKALLPKD